MQLTTYGHATVALDQDGQRVVLDPGVFADAAGALTGASFVLLTHEHFDHVDADAIAKWMAGNPSGRLWAPEPVVAQLRQALPDDAASRLVVAAPGDTFSAGAFAVVVGGGLHAVIHRDIPRAVNVTYLVTAPGGVSVYHPGDSFDAPPSGDGVPDVDVLLAPVSGPWMKLGEAIDFVREVPADLVIPIHEALLSEAGMSMTNTRLTAEAKEYRHMKAGESAEV